MNGKFDNLKEKVWGHFKDYQHVFLATSEENQPRVRPVTLVCLDRKFWILTGTNNKDQVDTGKSKDGVLSTFSERRKSWLCESRWIGKNYPR